MESVLAKLAEQWPILAFILFTVTSTAGLVWRQYWKREDKREAAAAARRKELETQAREDKESCEDRLAKTEERLTNVLQECVNRNTSALSEVGANCRELAGAVDRQTRAYSEGRELTPRQGSRRPEDR